MTITNQVKKFLIDAYFICVFILGTGAFVTLLVDTQDAAAVGAGSPVLKVAWGLVYLISLIRILPHRGLVARVLRQNKAMVFLLLLTLVSFLWSLDPVVTLHLAAALWATTLVAIDLSIHYSFRRQVQLLCIALLICMVLSVMADALAPGFIPGREAEGPSWHGIFGFKNNFGKMICLTFVTCLALVRRSNLLRLTVFVCGIGLAVLSKSASAVAYTALLCLILAMWSILKWDPKPRAAALLLVFTTVAISGYFAVQNFDRLMAMIDKDPHMTGRVDLWQYAMLDVQQRPILGYGYGAFWNYDSQPARRIRQAVKWDEAPHSQNGYIELSLSVGLLGLLTSFVMYGTMAKRGYRYFMAGPEAYRRWPLTLLAFVLIYSCTEAGFIQGNNISWILFASFAFSYVLAEEPVSREVRSTVRVKDEPFLLVPTVSREIY